MSMAAIGMGASIGASLIKGISIAKYSKREASRIVREARSQAAQDQILFMEQAEELERNAEKFEKRQAMQFTASGVTLRGTPLLVLQETRMLAEKDRQALERGHRLRQSAFLARAASQVSALRRQGRNALFGALLDSLAKGGDYAMKSGGQAGKPSGESMEGMFVSPSGAAMNF